MQLVIAKRATIAKPKETNMKYRFRTIALMAALTAQIASAQGRDSTIAGATVPSAVRDTLKAAGGALGVEFRGNTDNIITAEDWGSGTVYSFGRAFLPCGVWRVDM